MIDATWTSVDRGSAAIERLERDLERWRKPIREERARRVRDAHARWQAADDARRLEHQAAVAAWKAREAARLAHVERDRAIWEQQLAPARERLATDVRRSLRAGAVALPVALVAMLLTGAGVAGTVLFVLLAALLAALPALRSGVALGRLERRDPRRWSSAEPQPAAAPAAPLPAPEPEAPVDLRIEPHWWAELARHRRPPRPAEHGDAGVDRFLHVLSSLPDDYVVLREVPVMRSLDVDVLVVGPSGAWLFEVKYWSRAIVCSQGSWKRVREYYAPGGFLADERRWIEPVDQQWLREREAVTETLRRRLRDKAAFPQLHGGIVFSHPEASWQIDDSCRSGYGDPRFWFEQIRDAPPVAGFTRASQLAVVDALVRWGQKVDPTLASCAGDAAVLAEQLHRRAAEAAQAYVRERTDLAR